VADLERISGRPTGGAFDDAEFIWCAITLQDAVALIIGGTDGN